MHILVDALAMEAPLSRQRGIGVYTRRQFKELGALDQFNHYTFLRHGRFSEALPNNHDSVPIDRCGTVWDDRTIERNQRDVRNLLARRDFDAYYVTSPFELSYPPAFASANQPLIVTLYDLIPLIYQDRYLNHLAPSVRQRYFDAADAVRSADAVLAISECSRRDALRLLGLRPERVKVISAGVGEDFFRTPSDHEVSSALQALGIAGEYLFYPTGFDWRKNTEAAIQSYAALPHAVRRRHQLVIMCALLPEEEAHLRQVVTRSGCESGSVVLTGYVTDRQLRCLYHGATAVAFLSLYEGFGLPVAEAMACGRAVVASSTSAVGEILGGAGLPVDPLDEHAIRAALSRVLTDSGLRTELGERARKRAEQFTWRRVAERTKSAIEEAAFPRRSSTRRRRLAFVSPLPPEASGISDYSSALLPYLQKYFDITVVSSERAVQELRSSGSSTPALSYLEAERAFSDEAFDRILYQVGNSTYHREILHLMRQAPGIAVVHDLSLHAILHWLYRLGTEEERQWYLEAIEHAKRLSPEEIRRYAGRDYLDLLMSGDIFYERMVGAALHRCRGIIVHSRQGVEVMRSGVPGVPTRRIMHHGYTPARPERGAQWRAQNGLSPDDFVVSVLGAVAYSKRAEICVEALTRVPNSKVRLVFGGEVHPPMAGALADIPQLARELGVAERVLFTGRLSTDDFEALLAATDLGLVLRYPTSGETSGVLQRLISSGKPAVVTNVDAFSEYPDDFVWKVDVDEFECATVAAYINELSHNDPLIRAMAHKASAFAEHNLSLARVAAEYHRVLETLGET